MLCHRNNVLIVCQRRIEQFQTLCGGFKAVEIIKLCYFVSSGLKKIVSNFIEMCSNLVPISVYTIQCGLLLQHTSFTISFMCASNAMEQMFFRSIVVFQYISIIRQCGPSSSAFATRHNASIIMSKSLALRNSCLLHM